MSRPIKFRAWDKFNKEWVNLFIDENIYCTGQSSPKSESDGIAKYWLGTKGDSDYIWSQFTGLLDKNGKEIYEGDIAKYGKHIVWIDFYKGVFVMKSDEARYSYGIGSFDGRNLEVIGNIYESPDLLNQQRSQIEIFRS